MVDCPPELTMGKSLGIEKHPTMPNKVRCEVCKEGDPLRLGLWMNKGSLSKHLQSDNHATEVLRKAERDNIAQIEAQRLHQTYNGAAVSPNNEFPQIPVQTHFSFFDEPELSGTAPELPDNEPYWKGPAIPAFIEPITQNPSIERERLHQQFQELLQQAEHEDEFGNDNNEDDITVTNVANEFRSLGDFGLVQNISSWF